MATPATAPTSPTLNTLAVINASIGLVSVLVPEVGALIVGLKTIWLAANPGKSDVDWVAGLAVASSTLTSQADAQLLKDGYMQQPDGSWAKP